MQPATAVGSTRARRATAGMARPKYEPAPPEKKPLARTSSARSAGRAQQPRAAPPVGSLSVSKWSGAGGGRDEHAVPFCLKTESHCSHIIWFTRDMTFAFPRNSPFSCCSGRRAPLRGLPPTGARCRATACSRWAVTNGLRAFSASSITCLHHCGSTPLRWYEASMLMLF